MSINHVVKEGEHLSGIAEKYGFRDWETIWLDAANAALRGKRENAHALNPGDVAVIPDRQEKREHGVTGTGHTLVLAARELALRLKVLDLDFNAVARADFELGLKNDAPPKTG